MVPFYDSLKELIAKKYTLMTQVKAKGTIFLGLLLCSYVILVSDLRKPHPSGESLPPSNSE